MLNTIIMVQFKKLAAENAVWLFRFQNAGLEI